MIMYFLITAMTMVALSTARETKSNEWYVNLFMSIAWPTVWGLVLADVLDKKGNENNNSGQ